MRFIFGKFKNNVVAGIGSVLAVCSAALYGAFDVLPQPPEAHFSVGNPLDAGQWRIVPRGAWIGTGTIYGVPLKTGQKALVVEVELMNRTRASTKDYFDLFQFAAPAGAAIDTPMVVATRDPQMTPYLHPGMSERMAFIWTMPQSAKLPSSLALAVQAKTFKPVDNLYGVPGWYNQRRAGTVVLPLKTSQGVGPEPTS